MVGPEHVMDFVYRRLNRLLSVAEASLPPPQFRAFRKIALDEFGRNGLESELRELVRNGNATTD